MFRPAAFLKRLALSLFFALLPLVPAWAAPSALANINSDQFYTVQLGMQVLGSWALGSIIYSSFLLPKASRSRRYFYQLTLFWNLVNLILAISVFYFALTTDPELPLPDSIRLHYFIEKAILFFLGLDLALLLYGRLVQKNARMARKPERNWGYGRSIIIQSLFLICFHIGFYLFLMPFGPLLTDLVR